MTQTSFGQRPKREGGRLERKTCADQWAELDQRLLLHWEEPGLELRGPELLPEMRQQVRELQGRDPAGVAGWLAENLLINLQWHLPGLRD